MPSVFLSYSRTDLPLVEELLAHLQQAPAISIWRDQEKIYGGQKWPKILGEAIADQDIFILAWSKHSAASHFVEFEWTTAIALKKTIIPCLLDKTPLPPALSATQAIDYQKAEDTAFLMLQALQAKPPTQDLSRTMSVITQLANIEDREEAAVLKNIQSIFAAQQWIVEGNVYQAGGDIYIHQPLSPTGREKPLIEKWLAWVSLVAGIVSIITAFHPGLLGPPKLTVVPFSADVSGSDPFTAVLHEDGSSDKSADDWAVEKDQLQRNLAYHLDLGQKVSVLVVMTAGGNHPNASNSRVSDRYAVDAALNVSCFLRRSVESPHYLSWPFQGKTVASPYEWYSRSKTSHCGGSSEEDEHVLIIWVSAGDYQGHALEGIAGLLSQFLPIHYVTEVKIIGPRNSSEFQSMLEEIQYRSQTAMFSWHKGNGNIALYSPWATAMPGLLSYGLKTKNQSEGCNSYATCKDVSPQLLSHTHLDLQYSIASDAVLFESLLEELDRRQVTVGVDSIALIGEWDSFYARALPLTFSAAACRYITDATVKKVHTPSDVLMNKLRGKCATTEEAVDQFKRGSISPLTLHVRQYNYLSALEKAHLIEQQGKQTYSAEQTLPLSYGQRLVSLIKSEEQRDGDKELSGKIKAIGILGTDPQDTLSILQAVRGQFPTALFFTTNLDSQYLSEREQKWARNLIVISQFGLQLESSLQQAIPPFRNSLQTSTFFAVLRAIDQVGYRLQEPGQNRESSRFILQGPHDVATEYSAVIRPRLFEIGRYGAVDLSVDRPDNGTKNVHPTRTDVDARGIAKLPERIGRLWIVVTVLAFLALWGYGRVWNWLTARDELIRNARVFKRLCRTALLLLPVAGLYLLGLNLMHFNYAEDEPFSLSDGVSIWPTELLRLFAATLCFFFMIKADMDHGNNMRDLTMRFFSAENITKGTRKHRPNDLNGFWSNLDWMSHGSHHSETINADDLWLRYCTAHHWRHRAGRITLLYIVYMASIVQIFLFWTDDSRFLVPCRGDFSCGADHVASLLSVPLSTVLTLSVLDSVWLCIRWINELSRAAGLNARSAVRLLAERTRTVKRVIPYPLVVTMILLGARSHYFDNWDSYSGFYVMVSINSLLFIGCAFALYIAETRARREMIGGHGNEAYTV